MSMDALISSLEEEVSSVEDVLAATTKAYSRRAYGEKAWKAAAEFLVKQYGPVDAVKILHHKAMRRAHDAAEKRDVRGIVASVKSTVSTWPVKDILAESDETLDEGIRDAIKSVYNKFKEGFKKGLASRGKGGQFKGKPDYWRTVNGQSIGFTGSEGSGNPVIGPQQIISRMKAKTEAMQEAKSVDTPNLDNYLKMQIFRDKFDKNTASGRIAIFDQVDNDLSPENITWDGERPASEVRKAAKFLNQVMKELIALDPSLKSR